MATYAPQPTQRRRRLWEGQGGMGFRREGRKKHTARGTPVRGCIFGSALDSARRPENNFSRHASPSLEWHFVATVQCLRATFKHICM